MILSIVISLLIGLLGTYIDWLFKNWLESRKTACGKGPAAFPDVAGGKQAYLDKVQRKFWLGPKRIAIASNLYDKMVSRYHSQDAAYALDTSMDEPSAYKKLANSLVTGLTPDAEATA